MLHENLFQAGNALYLLGHSGKLVISRSDDNGATWSEPVTLEGEHRYQDGVGRIDHWNGRVYASYGRSFEAGPWSMPMVLSAPEDADAVLLQAAHASEGRRNLRCRAFRCSARTGVQHAGGRKGGKRRARFHEKVASGDGVHE